MTSDAKSRRARATSFSSDQTMSFQHPLCPPQFERSRTGRAFKGATCSGRADGTEGTPLVEPSMNTSAHLLIFQSVTAGFQGELHIADTRDLQLDGALKLSLTIIM
jgi:hypothetical protein